MERCEQKILNEKNMKKNKKIMGADAIRIAERDGLTLHKYADPVDGARIVTEDEAWEIIREDAGLVYCEMTVPNAFRLSAPPVI